MKLLALCVFLCALVAGSSAQTTKAPGIVRLQNTLGQMLALVRDIAVENNNIVSDTENQTAIDAANQALNNLRSLYSAFGSSSTSSLPLALRTKVNTAISNFKNAIAAWDTTLNDFPIDAFKLISSYQTVEKEFLNLAAAVIPL
uniref:Uncharacterized protein n=1 Tax=Anopheles farauti TaxID=69004 RepID=A0A182QR15_9DIPT